jgi:hypothetical protein
MTGRAWGGGLNCKFSCASAAHKRSFLCFAASWLAPNSGLKDGLSNCRL